MRSETYERLKKIKPGKIGASEGIRTLDFNLGKVGEYIYYNNK